VDEALLQALIYMGIEERPLGDKLETRPVIWRVSVAPRACGDKLEQPARVCHRLVVDERGDRGLAQVAGAQRGLVRVSQLRALGIGRSAMRHRIARGSLHVVLPSVLAVGSAVLQPRGMETAALLYAGDDVVISHESAAALWGLTPTPSFVAITMIERKVGRQPGVRAHRVRSLDVRDVQTQAGFPVTSPARTLIDCAARDLPLDRLLNEARVLKLVKDAEINAAMERCPGRTGIKALRALLAAEADTGFTRSRAERILKRIVSQAGLERPVFNASVIGVEADAYWPRLKLVIEVDGYQAHGHWPAFQRDRAKANKLVAAGYVVLRFTWHQLTQRPMQVVAEIVRTLARLEAQAA
jgi:very-short-patch-repair endonuclease